MTATESYNQRIENTKMVKGILSKKHNVEICNYDKTALLVYCSEKQLEAICKEYRCSGFYNDKLNVGIITNF